MQIETFPCGATRYTVEWFSDALPHVQPLDVVIFYKGPGDVPHGFVYTWCPKREYYIAYKRSTGRISTSNKNKYDSFELLRR